MQTFQGLLLFLLVLMYFERPKYEFNLQSHMMQYFYPNDYILRHILYLYVLLVLHQQILF
jgi:hypothetical protein